MIGRDQRPSLFHVRAQDIAQSGVQQVRGRVIAHITHAAFGIGDGCDVIAHVQVFFRDDAVRDQSGDGVVRAAHLGNFERARIVVEAAGIGDLPAGFGIDRSAVEHDFGFGPRFDLIHRALLGDDRFDARVARLRAKIKFLLRLVRLRQLRVNRIRRVFVGALP